LFRVSYTVSISSFRRRLDSLLKVKRGVYAGAPVHLDIYPKRGPSQQLDIDKFELDRLIAEFRSEMLADTLVEHDINNNLSVIL